jgi:hypothetical protein
MHERFDASRWRKEQQPGHGWLMPKRVYIHELDLMLKPDEARLLLESTARARSLFGCRDSHCCPRNVKDMLENPARHFLYRRIQDVAGLGQTPESLRAQTFLERTLRPMTDRALAAANINWSDEAMANKTRDQRKRLVPSGLRSVIEGGSSAAVIRFSAGAANRPGRAELRHKQSIKTRE